MSRRRGRCGAARAVGAAGDEDDTARTVAALAAGRLRCQCETGAGGETVDADNGLVSPHVQVELLHDGAEVGQVLLARALAAVRSLKRHAGDRDALVGAEEPRAR